MKSSAEPFSYLPLLNRSTAVGLRFLLIINLVTLGTQSAYAGTPDCVAETIRTNLQGALFLHGLNPALHKTPMVERAERILMQLGEKNPKDVQKKIAAWLSVVEQTHSERQDQPEVLNRLKNFYYREHVISEKDFPESYFDLQKKIAREQGRGETELSPQSRAEHIRAIKEDQRKSLDPWIEYLTSPDAMYPMWAKVWSFNGMTRIGKIDGETGNVISRSSKTVAPFIELNREALSLSIDAVEKLLNAKQKGLKYKDIEPNAQLRELVQGGNFGKLYGFYVHVLANNAIDLKVTEGTWVKYPRGSDPKPLVQSLQCKNTGWCTAGESTAASQLKGGDFYVYYTNDNLGRPQNPRIAIRMEGNSIGEVRGIGPSQELDPVMASSGILDQKLNAFGNEGKRYNKRSSDMKLLTLIEQKQEASEDLTEAELRFLYEIDSKIEGFGYKEDPRIADIREKRDMKSDLSTIFHVKPEEISFTQEEALSGTKRVHYGSLNLGKLKRADGLKLPEVVIGGLDLDGLTQSLVLPKVVLGHLKLGSLTSAEGLKLPEIIRGDVDLRSLTSAKGITFPKEIRGDVFLDNVTSAEGLSLPEVVHGTLLLSNVKSAEGLKLPKVVKGILRLTRLKSAEGLVFPDEMSSLFLNSLESNRGLILPRKLEKNLFVPNGIQPQWVD